MLTLSSVLSLSLGFPSGSERRPRNISRRAATRRKRRRTTMTMKRPHPHRSLNSQVMMMTRTREASTTLGIPRYPTSEHFPGACCFKWQETECSPSRESSALSLMICGLLCHGPHEIIGLVRLRSTPPLSTWCPRYRTRSTRGPKGPGGTFWARARLHLKGRAGLRCAIVRCISTSCTSIYAGMAAAFSLELSLKQ